MDALIQEQHWVERGCKQLGFGEIPQRYEVLKNLGSSTVLRVWLAGGSVVAKRDTAHVVENQRRLYQEVLNTLPVSTLRCYGSAPDENPELQWLFLEDAGENAFSNDDPAHRERAARWLAELHTSAATGKVASTLEEAGPARYLTHLQSGRDQIHQACASGRLPSGDVEVLHEILLQLDEVASHWDDIEAWRGGFPETLVHGDFVPKNLRIRERDGGLDLFALDWETAGWATPGPDLCLGVDLEIYWPVMRCAWPHIPFVELELLREQGRIYRLLAAIDWAAYEVNLEWFQKGMYRLADYRVRLAECLSRGEWVAA